MTCASTRARYNALPWPTWSLALAPDSTLFLPLTHRSQSVYETVPGNDGDERNTNLTLPPNYNSLATFPRWRPPTPGVFGHPTRGQESDTTENSQDHEEEERKEGRESGVVSRTRHALNSVLGRIHQALDDSDSETESTMTPILRSVDRIEATGREDSKEERERQGHVVDIEMGTGGPRHNV